jgi:hypothetical protein
MHPLDDAIARKERARGHLDELRRLCGDFERRETEAATSAAGFTITVAKPIPELIRVIAGEIVEHLRATLEYLAYRLAVLDAGEGKFSEHRIQFLIEDDPKVFRKKRPDRLQGINDAHAAIIEALQPFRGCEWTKQLRDLTNSHKHRMLVIAEQRPVLWLAGLKDRADPIERFADVEATMSFRIAFDDGSFVIDTLEHLHAEVGTLLDAFAPEFE